MSFRMTRRELMSLLGCAGLAHQISKFSNRALANSEEPLLQNSDTALEILIYGDAGDGSRGQEAVAEAMWRSHQLKPFDFAVSVGDNQYVSTQTDTFESIFARPYARLIEAGLPFFQTVGNHDWEFDRVADQLDYSRKVDALSRGVGGFILQDINQVIRRKNLKWIIISTCNAFAQVTISKETREFLIRELSEEFQGWKIVSSHLPFFSSGIRGDNAELQRELMPILTQYPVDFYFAGHEHQAEFFKPWDWMGHAIVGNGREARMGRTRSALPSLYFMGELGFARLSIQDDWARFALVNTQAAEVYATSFQRKPGVWAEISGQQGNKIQARLRLLNSGSPSDSTQDSIETLVPQFAFASEPRDPLLYPADWKALSAAYKGQETKTGLHLFETELPRDAIGSYALARFFVPSQRRWIYADKGDRTLSGNYDGLRDWPLIKPF